ncbi:UV DNA damage repair endonuclease UvsE [Fictibacillus phosphorivorans]|uniref:UV DNA damage repair endonuclease UvsE n=1 Tax=Fictibacillus phosphorivorans TaxID=1221500 RepID=UPI002041CEB6|nr:UV DNA damage repair endonuclease UvsE [Fictibacillus phosphorivorans]MCM3719412.1 UV DNA damage repair endonuclease UvsE [Fictibacillus phosphorivorans]MCM3777110.1 UV DNA damage repair endonuclease UvsE [Fictibacillus phosphorivorans]
MTIIRLGFVAMSMELKNASPSQTMTYKQFSQLQNREAGLRKLERISLSNVTNTLRILKHAVAHDVTFYRMTSRLIPLANHSDLLDWDYISPLTNALHEMGHFAQKHKMRLDFHPDHFVLINSPKKEVLKNSLKTLQLHYKLLKNMGIDPTHRCVMHVGGNYKETDVALERFVQNWAFVPVQIQKMIMLENDDTSFTMADALYLCEKLQIPLVFDYHHHLAYHQDENWVQHWPRVVESWKRSPLPLKMHISSPKSEKQFRHHADYVDVSMLFDFLKEVKGSVEHIDCMIESKKKDVALFQLMREIKERKDVEIMDGASFRLK